MEQHIDTLPVVRNAGLTRLLIDEAGAPAWPARTRGELDLLASAADRVGATLRVVDAQRSAAPAARPGGVVASFEADLWLEGELYAHLTGRRFIGLEDARRLSETEELEVVVCSAEAITSALLHLVYDRARPVGPGIVYGRTADELRAQILRASAIARLRPRAEGTYVQICPDLGTGSAAERAWVASAVALDPSVLAVLTHSDGLDAPLAKGDDQGNLLICPIRAPLDVAAHRTPECRHAGWCHRVRLPVEEAFARGELIAPQALRARALVWSTCYGAMDSGAPLDRQWSVVHQLGLSPHVDVVLAKWRAAFGHGPLAELVAGLAGGASVGEVVAAFNATAGIRERGAQFAIFGDPRVTAPFQEAHPAMDAYYLAPRPAPGGDARRGAPPRAAATDEAGGGVAREHLALLALLRRCAGAPLRHGDEEREAAAARARFEQALAALEDGGAAAPGLAELQRAALDCFRRHGDVIRGWQPLAASQRFVNGRPCAHCGDPKTEAITALAAPHRPRRIGTCPRCQIVEDAPADFDLDFRVTGDGELELVGEIPPGRFSGLVVVWSTTPLMGAVQRWPEADDGGPLRRIALDVARPRATARVTAWMMFDLQYLTLNHRVPGTLRAQA